MKRLFFILVFVLLLTGCSTDMIQLKDNESICVTTGDYDINSGEYPRQIEIKKGSCNFVETIVEEFNDSENFSIEEVLFSNENIINLKK